MESLHHDNERAQSHSESHHRVIRRKVREENRCGNQHRNTQPLHRFHTANCIPHVLKAILFLPGTPNFLVERFRAPLGDFFCSIWIVHVATLSLLSVGLIRQATSEPLATAAKLVIPYINYSGILKSLNPAMIFSEITSGGGQRGLPVEGKNPDLRHLSLVNCVTSRPVRATSPR